MIGKGRRIDLDRYRASQNKRKERQEKGVKLANCESGKGNWRSQPSRVHTKPRSKRVAILVSPKSFCPFLSLAPFFAKPLLLSHIIVRSSSSFVKEFQSYLRLWFLSMMSCLLSIRTGTNKGGEGCASQCLSEVSFSLTLCLQLFSFLFRCFFASGVSFNLAF